MWSAVVGRKESNLCKGEWLLNDGTCMGTNSFFMVEDSDRCHTVIEHKVVFRQLCSGVLSHQRCCPCLHLLVKVEEIAGALVV